MKVFMSTRRRMDRMQCVHITPNCARRGPLKSPLVEVDIKNVEHPRPCRYCFPTQPPAVRTLHEICRECSQAKPHPCEHNGGVRVWVAHGRPELGEYIKFVWPENAWRFRLASPAEA